MSKVKCFKDTKLKAIHRQRRYETLHKKLSRAQKAERDEYHYWGYYVIRKRERSLPLVRVVDKITNGSYWIHPVEQIGGEVFIVKRINRNAKDLKREAARRLRRHPIDPESVAYRGSTYKKDLDIPWTLL